MELSASSATAALSSALNTQKTLAPSLITKTLDHLNTGKSGMTPVMNPDYEMQKTVLTAAYLAPGKGTRLNLTV